MDLTKEQIEDLREILGEAIHTAFRKGSDHKNAGKIWSLIRDLPEEEWGNILEFIILCVK
jgi:hypothetical protein